MKRHFLGKTLILFTVVSLLLCGAPLAVRADIVADYAVVSGTDNLNLRQGPGSEYGWLGSAPEGAWVRLLGESGNWYYVVIVNSGLTGYMSKNFLVTSGTTDTTTGVVNNPVSTQFLNLRQYPSLTAPVLGIYYNGAVFRVVSAVTGWYQVEIDGLTGYFRQEFVRINAGGNGGTAAYVKSPNSGKVNLRSAPTFDGSSILGQYSSGTPVTVLLKGRDFWKVSVNGLTGYMVSAYVTASSSQLPPITPSPANPRPATKGYAIVNNPKPTQFLNLRAQPSTSAKIIAQYKNGIRFEVVAPGEAWCKVYGSASGNTGYIMTKYLKLYNVSSFVKTVQNGNTYVNLRSAPSKSSGTVYQRVYSGAQVTVLTPGDEWTQVRYGNTVGYMMTCFLK